MSYKIITTNRFERSLKKCLKRGLDPAKIKVVLQLLARDGKLPSGYRPHKLKGKYIGKWECHIEPDWLLIWEQKDEILTLILLDTGTHSDLFKK